MTGYLLDTNAISELKRRPDAKASAFIASKSLDRLYLSVVIVAEFVLASNSWLTPGGDRI